MRFNKASAKSCTWVGATPRSNKGWGLKALGATLGVLVEEKVHISQQCVPAAQKASFFLGYSKASIWCNPTSHLAIPEPSNIVFFLTLQE